MKDHVILTHGPGDWHTVIRNLLNGRPRGAQRHHDEVGAQRSRGAIVEPATRREWLRGLAWPAIVQYTPMHQGRLSKGIGCTGPPGRMCGAAATPYAGFVGRWLTERVSLMESEREP